MKILILLFFIALAGCSQPAMVPKAEYLKLIDSIETLNTLNKLMYEVNLDANNSIVFLKDSITDLKDRPIMSSDQFLQLYKYERLHKYYLICVKNPKQWKYYKGWSVRVFGQ